MSKHGKPQSNPSVSKEPPVSNNQSNKPAAAEAPKTGEVNDQSPANPTTGQAKDAPVADATIGNTPSGELQPPEVAVTAKAAPAPAEKTGTVGRLADRPEVVQGVDEESELSRILGDLSEAEITNIRQLQHYIREMSPEKVLSPEAGASRQVGLARILSNIVNNEEANFEPVLRATLKLFDLHRNGVFHPSQVFRFIDNNEYTVAKQAHELFVGLVNLFTIAGPTKGRDIAVKSVDFDKTLRHGLTEEARSRVKAFFKA